MVEDTQHQGEGKVPSDFESLGALHLSHPQIFFCEVGLPGGKLPFSEAVSVRSA